MKINENFDAGFSIVEQKPRKCFNEFYKGKSWVDRNNTRFGEDLLKRCFIIKLLWRNNLCLDMDFLKEKFIKEYPNDTIDKYVNEIEDQGLIYVGDNKIHATQREINRVRIGIINYSKNDFEDSEADL